MDSKPKRKKYAYSLIIYDLHLDREFNLFCKSHKHISYNRLARAFLVHKKVDYKKFFYEVDWLDNSLQDLIRIAKTPWLSED